MFYPDFFVLINKIKNKKINELMYFKEYIFLFFSNFNLLIVKFNS